jgi:hypothetical protein
MSLELGITCIYSAALLCFVVQRERWNKEQEVLWADPVFQADARGCGGVGRGYGDIP